MKEKKKKREETNKWWKYDEDFVIVYTDRTTKLKYKGKPMAEYLPNMSSVKAFAKQYKVRMGSTEQKQLFNELGISDKDEIKPYRKPRERKEKALQV